MVCINVYLVYVDAHDVFNISLFGDVQRFCIDVIHNLPNFFLIWSFQNIIVSVQYIDSISTVENAVVNLALTKNYC